MGFYYQPLQFQSIVKLTFLVPNYSLTNWVIIYFGYISYYAIN